MNKKITKIERQKNNPHRINVYVNGEFSFGLSEYVGAWLQVGQLLDNTQISKLLNEDSIEVAFQKALKYINYRPRSEYEVWRRLIQSGFEKNAINGAILRLKKTCILDDQKFAEEWVENRSSFRPRSHSLLKMELRKKHINEEIIEEVVGAIPADTKLALDAAKKVLYKYEKLDKEIFKKKLYGFLARRGFNYSVIKDVCEKVWSKARIDVDNPNMNF